LFSYEFAKGIGVKPCRAVNVLLDELSNSFHVGPLPLGDGQMQTPAPFPCHPWVHECHGSEDHPGIGRDFASRRFEKESLAKFDRAFEWALWLGLHNATKTVKHAPGGFACAAQFLL
jgi:hypothetical protein